MRTLRRVLIVHPYGIGDLLFVTPVLRALRLIPSVETVDLLLGSRTREIVEHNPHVNDIFVADKDRAHRQTWLENLRDNLELGRKLRAKHYDLILDYSLRREHAFLGRFLLGIPRCAGFAYKKRAIFHNIRYPLPEGFWKRHVVDFYCDLAEAAGIPVEDRFLEYYPPSHLQRFFYKSNDKATKCFGGFRLAFKKDEPSVALAKEGFHHTHGSHEALNFPAGMKDVEEVLQKLELLPERFLAVAPGGGDSWGKEASFKRWPVKYFAELVAKLQKERDLRGVAILGSGSERELCEELQALIKSHSPSKELKVNGTSPGNLLGKENGSQDKPPSVVLAGETTLAQTAMVLKKSALFVGNDGGLVHLAHALHVPLIALYGPVPPQVYGPYPPSPDAIAVFKQSLDCRPCYYKFRYNNQCQTIACLKDLTPDEVMSKIRGQATFS
jgi:ADP-heptose:LPS heptosyltransferase